MDLKVFHQDAQTGEGFSLAYYCKVIQTFTYVDEALLCDRSNESYWAEHLCGIVYFSLSNKMKLCNLGGERVNTYSCTWVLLLGDNSCSRLKQCTHICLAVPNSYTCACPDNMRTVTTASGIVSCECQPGEFMDPNGECKTRSEYLTVIATAVRMNLWCCPFNFAI